MMDEVNGVLGLGTGAQLGIIRHWMLAKSNCRSRGMISAWALSVVVSTTSVPTFTPGEGNAYSGQDAIQPVIRRCERCPVDQARKQAWLAYCRELDRAWAAYRAAGSTPEAMDKYKKVVGQAKTRYIYQDPYYTPILP